MSEPEDLMVNPFFQTLKTKFSTLYQQIETNCWFLCVPRARSCQGLKYSKEIFETHILEPSPYFQGQYITRNKKQIEIENQLLITKQGFAQERHVKVLFEELFYNSQYKPFTVFCIDAPLEGGSVIASEQFPLIELPKQKEFGVCKEFLLSSPVNQIVLAKVDNEINQFNRNQTLVKGFEMTVSTKISAICDHAVEALLCANPDFRTLYKSNNPQLTEFRQIVECYVLGQFHEVLFKKLNDFYRQEDEMIYQRTLELQHLTPQDFGVNNQLDCDLDSSIELFRQLDSKITPIEKLLLLQDVTNEVTKAISERVSSKDSFAISSDDLLPLIVNVVIKAKPKTLQTNIIYMHNFIFFNLTTHALGFTLATFDAAVEFLKSDSLGASHITSSIKTKTFIKISPSPKKEDTMHDKPFNMMSLKRTSSVEPPRLWILENSNTTTTNTNKTSGFKPPPEIIEIGQKKKQNDLGEFLSSLRNDNY